MDESPMGRALGAHEFAGTLPPGEASAGADARRAPLPWRNYARCLLLFLVLCAAGAVAFRPGMFRLSLVMSLVSPSRGESLAWKPEEEEAVPAAPVKFTLPPDEWRPAAGHSAGWFADRPGARDDDWRGGRVDALFWKRESSNPWAWPDDAARADRHEGDAAADPAQKPASPFRTGDTQDWARGTESAAAPVAAIAQSAEPAPTASPFAGAGPERVPSVAPLAPLTPLEPIVTEAAPAAPILLPPLPAVQSVAQPAGPAAETVSPPATSATISPSEALSAAFASAAPEPEPANWLEREITEAIPGAYLTIYPRLKFIGLCVPGQGYIRKYNQIAVPMDLAGPKAHAADGRTPYGKYYVAAHVRDAGGARVVLSWPSAEDARRAGAGPEMLAEIESAWRRQSMPPQDSLAGGGLSLTGDRDRVEYTAGGFSLEAPHMEEIYTALPDGAWVFVQQ